MDYPRFSAFANLCRSERVLQNFAEKCKFEEELDLIRETLKNQQRCQTYNKNV